MIDLKIHIVHPSDNIKEALRRLEDLPDFETLTLFVIDNDGKMVGSLTDGDIRRGFLRGLALSDRVQDFMKTRFYYLDDNGMDPVKIKEINRIGVKLLPVLDKDGKIIRVIDFKTVKTVLPVDAVLMAGGRGERLRPLTDTIPKPLLKVGNKAIIDYNIDHLRKFGIRNYYLTIRYLGELIEKHLGNGIDRDINIHYVKETTPLGTFGSVGNISDFKSDVVMVMNSDLFTNIDLDDFYQDFIQQEADMSIATFPYTVDIPYAVLNLRDKLVEGLSEKPTYTYHSNAGIYLIKRELIKIEKVPEYLDVTDFMESIIKMGKRIIRYPIVGFWVDIGKHEDYQKVQEIVKHIDK
ncbi:MAG: NTP transferase domain-containing protein [Bacteroidales bacterium]|nr:NTP transferase domain-containing protein [Bacteroidales bacterium]